MNRVIKFRAWDKELKTMHVIGEDSHDSWLVDEEGYFRYSNLQNGEGSGEHGVYELMQYIGRKDEKDREIYEEDIVSVIEQGHVMGYYYEDEFIGVVRYDEEHCVFKLELIKFERGGEPIPDQIDGIPISREFEDEIIEFWFGEHIVEADIKILGNSFENPELLKGASR